MSAQILKKSPIGFNFGWVGFAYNKCEFLAGIGFVTGIEVNIYAFSFNLLHEIFLCCSTHGCDIKACRIRKSTTKSKDFLISLISSDGEVGQLIWSGEITNCEENKKFLPLIGSRYDKIFIKTLNFHPKADLGVWSKWKQKRK